MNQNGFQTIYIDIKDVFLYVLKNAFVILLIGVFIAGIFGGYGYIKDINTSSDNDYSLKVLDINNRLVGESDVEYDKRVQVVNRAQTIMVNIETMNSQCDNLRKYISDSLLMQLDPMSVSVSEAQFIIELNSNENAGLDDALIESYINDVMSGEYIYEIADKYGYEAGALQELLAASNTAYNSDLVIDNNSVPVRLLSIRVWGDSSELTEALLDGAINEIFEKYNDYNSVIANHTITEIGRQSYVTFVLTVRDTQLKTMTTYQTLQSQIDSNNKFLDDIAKQLGLSDRNSLYVDASNSASGNSGFNGLSLKNLAIGFVFGVVLAMGAYICKYIFGSKIISQTHFAGVFNDCKVIGVLKPIGRRNTISTALDRISEDDIDLPDDKINALVSTNLKNISKGMNKVLFTGTINEDTAKRVVSELKYDCDVRVDVFNNPEILESLTDYDGVVLLEQRGVSEKKKVRKELDLLRNGVKSIIGAIII